tara:strand:+ start:343 stop:1497 length:1155 start_codon:yes stop_codon:yes gene_type:complete
MGFFSKIFKGVKKVFKKIGKGIKSAFKSVGKFMGKLGIVGQIALGLLLPGIGTMLGTWAGAAMGSANVLVSAAGHFVNAAVQIGTKVGSVFKTVTEGVTAVVGETVGAVLNKIPGASDLVKTVTSKIGLNAGQGIDISQKGFGSLMDVASKAVTDVASAGSNLFSMDTLTGMNKYGAQALAKANAMGPNLTDTPNMSRIEIPEAPAPQMSALDAGDTTNLVDFKQPSLLAQDMAVPPVSVEGLKGLDLSSIDVTVPTEVVADTVAKEAVTKPESWITEQVSGLATDFVDTTKKTFTDVGGNLVNKAFDINQPQAANVTYNQAVMPDLLNVSSDIRMGRGMEFDPLAYSENTNFFALNPYGNSALQNYQHEKYLNERLNYAQGSR